MIRSDVLAVAVLLIGRGGRGFVTGKRTGALVGWIAVGALLTAVVAWGGATVLGVEEPTLALAFGAAAGGGLGALVSLALADEDGGSAGEDVTVHVEREREREPRPADLFDDHPDPVVYVVVRDGEPVVRAVNRAYLDRFPTGDDAATDVPLVDVLRTDDAAVIADAVGDGLDAVTECETRDGVESFRIREASVGADGYVLFTPVADRTD